MSKCLQPVCISDDTAENTLIVAEQHECELTRNRNRGPKLEAPPIPVVMRRLEHFEVIEMSKWGDRVKC